MLSHARVEVVAAQPRVAARREGLHDTAANHKNAHVERATAQVEHEDDLLGHVWPETVRHRRRHGLAYGAYGGETRRLTRAHRGGHRLVAEVCGDADHRLRDGLAQLALGVAQQCPQHLSSDSLGR
mmetsp:Transcript_5534/g.21817  ORF Transcript_5534/g.21817 Transcript_5534/m.21817 type:complete len:126 (-) Transcript_5534:68-445(-)